MSSIIQTWLDSVSDTVSSAFQTAMEDRSIKDPPKSVTAEYWFEDESFIEVTVSNTNTVSIILCHRDDNNSRDCPNVVDCLRRKLPNWSEFYEEFLEQNRDCNEWTEHGFRNEADYWHYRLG